MSKGSVWGMAGSRGPGGSNPPGHLPASLPSWGLPFPTALPDLKGPSFPEKPLWGFQERRGDKEETANPFNSNRAVPPLDPSPSQRETGVGAAGFLMLHFILKPPWGWSVILPTV